MTFLPEELTGAEERTCTHLPAHHVTPLVAHQWKVAPRLDPVLICVPDDGLAGRTDNQFFLQLGSGINHHTTLIFSSLQTIVGNHGAFLGKAFYMLCLFGEERLGDEQREVGILCTCLLEHQVKLMLHLLPDSVAIGFDDHTAAHCRLLSEVGLYDQVVVPLTIVVGTFCQFF